MFPHDKLGHLQAVAHLEETFSVSASLLADLGLVRLQTVIREEMVLDLGVIWAKPGAALQYHRNEDLSKHTPMTSLFW